MSTLQCNFRSLFLPSNRLLYLALFRVILGIVILTKILFLLPSLRFLHGPDGLLGEPQSFATSLGFVSHIFVSEHIYEFYAIYALFALMMIFGACGRMAIFFTILCGEIHSDLNWLLLDGGDNLLQFSVLYLAFADSFQYLSIQKSPPVTQEYSISNFLTNVAVAAIILHICLVYLISGLSKAHADVWYHGIAMYYILLSERFQGTTLNELFGKNALFNFIVCYTTIIWESTFPFAVFVRRLRIFVLLIGVLMHLSIFVLMMIQSFQFIYIFHYGFFFSDSELSAFLENIRTKFFRRSVRLTQADTAI